MAQGKQSDWISRITVPDVYPRRQDPFRPGTAPLPDFVPGDGGEGGFDESLGPDLYRHITQPSTRPVVYQRAVNIQLTANVAAIPLVSQRFECDTIVVDVPSTAANSVFLGYGAAVSTTSGLEARPGLPLIIKPENSREQWELQRTLEAIAAMLANDRGMTPLPPYRAPRVVFNAAEYWVIASAATVLSVMLFYVPEMQ